MKNAGEWPLADLAGVGDLAREHGVTAQAVSNWSRRHEDFPGPLVTLAGGAVYSREQVRVWVERRALG